MLANPVLRRWMQENQNSVHCPLWLHLKVVTSLDYMIDGLKKKNGSVAKRTYWFFQRTRAHNFKRLDAYF